MRINLPSYPNLIFGPPNMQELGLHTCREDPKLFAGLEARENVKADV